MPLKIFKKEFRVLLIGDYSGVHYEIAEELRKRKVNVDLLSSGDGYKNFESNLKIKKLIIIPLKIRYFSEISKGILDYSGLKGLFTFFINLKLINNLKNYQVVQIINPIALEDFGSIANYLLLKKIVNNNEKLFLCAVGDDLTYVKYCLDGKFKYSGLNSLRYAELGGMTFNYLRVTAHSLRYVYGFFYRKLNDYVLGRAIKIIPGASDYFLAYRGNTKITDIVPFPVNPANFLHPVKTCYPVKIFLGIQAGKEYRKGHPFFLEALKLLIKNYGDDKVSIKIVSSLPYSEYLQMFRDCDIFLDQCLGHGIGVNAALGLSAGKVVFSGSAPSFGECTKIITIDAPPSVDVIYNQLANLMDNLSTIDDIKNQSYKYALKYNAANNVVDKYLDIWVS